MNNVIYIVEFDDGMFEFFNNCKALDGVNMSVVAEVFEVDTNMPVSEICEYCARGRDFAAFTRYGRQMQIDFIGGEYIIR